MELLNIIPNTIRDMLKHERPLSQVYVASLFTISKNCSVFQAKVHKLYITQGVSVQEYYRSQSHVPNSSVSFAVVFIYSDENIGRLG